MGLEALLDMEAQRLYTQEAKRFGTDRFSGYPTFEVAGKPLSRIRIPAFRTRRGRGKSQIINEVRKLPPLFQILKKGKPMFDFDASCPHCVKKFKLNRIGLEAKAFRQCPHCRRMIKVDLADPEKEAIRIAPDFAENPRFLKHVSIEDR